MNKSDLEHFFHLEDNDILMSMKILLAQLVMMSLCILWPGNLMGMCVCCLIQSCAIAYIGSRGYMRTYCRLCSQLILATVLILSTLSLLHIEPLVTLGSGGPVIFWLL